MSLGYKKDVNKYFKMGDAILQDWRVFNYLKNTLCRYVYGTTSTNFNKILHLNKAFSNFIPSRFADIRKKEMFGFFFKREKTTFMFNILRMGVNELYQNIRYLNRSLMRHLVRCFDEMPISRFDLLFNYVFFPTCKGFVTTNAPVCFNESDLTDRIDEVYNKLAWFDKNLQTQIENTWNTTRVVQAQPANVEQEQEQEQQPEQEEEEQEEEEEIQTTPSFNVQHFPPPKPEAPSAPSFEMVQDMKEEEDSSAYLQEDCAICLDRISIRNSCYITCAHVFHRTCYEKMREVSSQCPICRVQIED